MQIVEGFGSAGLLFNIRVLKNFLMFVVTKLKNKISLSLGILRASINV
jgi:hypothetical protein